MMPLFSPPGLRLGIDLFAFAEFASRGQQRFDLLMDHRDEYAAPLFDLSKTAPWVPVNCNS